MKSLSEMKELEKKLANKVEYSAIESHFPPDPPTFMFKVASYALVLGVIIPSIQLFMHGLNRTMVVGRENIDSLGHKWILASNHLTMLDDLFLGPVALFPKFFKGYDYFPFHAPEERNFYKAKLMTWFMRHTKCIPLVRGKGILQLGMDRIIKAVNNDGILHIYPEGTRSRTGEIGAGRPGIGRIVCETNVPVVPMYHQGLENILPIGSKVPRIGKQVRVVIGKPLYFKTEIEPGSEAKTWRLISNQVVDAIRDLRDLAESQYGAEKIDLKPHP